MIVTYEMVIYSPFYSETINPVRNKLPLKCVYFHYVVVLSCFLWFSIVKLIILIYSNRHVPPNQQRALMRLQLHMEEEEAQRE